MRPAAAAGPGVRIAAARERSRTAYMQPVLRRATRRTRRMLRSPPPRRCLRSPRATRRRRSKHITRPGGQRPAPCATRPARRYCVVKPAGAAEARAPTARAAAKRARQCGGDSRGSWQILYNSRRETGALVNQWARVGSGAWQVDGLVARCSQLRGWAACGHEQRMQCMFAGGGVLRASSFFARIGSKASRYSLTR